MESEEHKFAESMQALRLRRGWSQGELARRMVAAGWDTYSQMTVSRTEKFQRPIRLDEAFEIARIFGVDLRLMAAGLDSGEEALTRLRTARRQLLSVQRAGMAAFNEAEEALVFARTVEIDPDSQVARWLRALEEDVARLLETGETQYADDEDPADEIPLPPRRNSYRKPEGQVDGEHQAEA